MNGVAFAGVQGVALGGQHHAHGGAAVPIELEVFEHLAFAIGRGQQHIDQIGFEAHHDGLCFGVAHAAVELEGFDLSLGVDH